MLYLGTSGYYYREWIGTVYPKTTNIKTMFNEYLNKGFNAVELNFSYYRQPSEKIIRDFSIKAPDGFKYIIKAYKGITHIFEGNDTIKDYVNNYKKGNVKNNYEGVLFQFPESFHFNKKNLEIIKERIKYFEDIPSYIEFRGSDWNREDIYGFLKDNKMNYVITDLPQKPNLHKRELEVTNKNVYYRLHGRNNDWYNPKERYNYNYNNEELAIFASEIKMLSTKATNVFVFFNNCHGGFALTNALKIEQMIGDSI